MNNTFKAPKIGLFRKKCYFSLLPTLVKKKTKQTKNEKWSHLIIYSFIYFIFFFLVKVLTSAININLYTFLFVWLFSPIFISSSPLHFYDNTQQF